KALPLAKHVARHGLTLPLGHDPMLDPQTVPAMRIGPPRNVAGGEDAGNTGFQILVDYDAAVDFQPGALGQLQPRPHPDADHDQVGGELAPALEGNVTAGDCCDGVLEMEDDAVL